MNAQLELLGRHACFGGEQRFYRHESAEIGLPMKFGIYLPPQALSQFPARVPVLIYLAGLTCTEETFAVKAGAQRFASELGLALVMPDTSPRGAGIAGEADSWDFGVGAGFYLDATQQPWGRHWHMESYVVHELRALLAAEFPLDLDRLGLFGHSMGGYGALTLALRHPGVFRSLSAFAPITAPMHCPWGEKAFAGYFGPDRQAWELHDPSALMAAQNSQPYPGGILIDQGLDDPFLVLQLNSARFEDACAHVGQPLTLRRHAGYDHGYYFISTFIKNHLEHHAQALATMAA